MDHTQDPPAMAGGIMANRAQEEAIGAINGPVMVVSCPGSGKTTTLIRRIHNMISSGIRPSGILMVTFTKAAADDMRSRYISMYGENPGITFATIHSLCFHILKVDGGYDRKDVVYGENEKLGFILDRVQNFPEIGDAFEAAKDIADEISFIKNTDADIENYTPKSCEKKTFVHVYRAYEKEKFELGKIDFDDMLVRCRDLLTDRPDILAKWQRTFSHIQCDEYQDTNRIQMDILYMLAGDRANLCVVGDDDQSIYGFRGAESSIMLGFEEDFAGKAPKKIMMSTNYRSAQTIVDYADACIQFNRKRFRKEFISERGKSGEIGTVEYKKVTKQKTQFDDIINVIKDAHEKGVPYKEMAILFRKNSQASSAVQALSEAGIPFCSTESPKSVYDGWIFRDIKAYADLSMGKDEESNLLYVLNKPNRYLRSAMFKGAEFTADGMMKALSYLEGDPQWKRVQAEKNVLTMLNCFGRGKITRDTPSEKLFAKLKGPGSVRYDRHISNFAKFRMRDQREVTEEFAALEEDAKKYGTVGAWFEHAERVRRIMRENSKKNDRNGVAVTTMHKSKGLEWKYVFVIGVNDGIVPIRDAVTETEMEEERRLLYVAMTRAKDNLYIYSTGEESLFMEQTKTAMDRKTKPKIKKRLAGAPVKHRLYGNGKVKGYTRDKILITFEDGKDRQFVFPDAVRDGIVEYAD